jgi:hypothetical protein
VDLAADDLAELLIEDQLDGFLLLLALLLLSLLSLGGRGAEDLGLHLEELVERDTVLGVLGLDRLLLGSHAGGAQLLRDLGRRLSD